MDILPDDLILRIISFLSLKEIILMREVNHPFLSYINPLLLSALKLENSLKTTYVIEMKQAKDLTCYATYHNFTIFTNHKPANQVHSLFRININEPYNKCIDDRCREKKLGYIFFSKKSLSPNNHQTSHWHSYIKRNIPYCNKCFKKWT